MTRRGIVATSAVAASHAAASANHWFRLISEETGAAHCPDAWWSMASPHRSLRREPTRPLACVMSSMDLVRPLGLAGVRSAVVARPGSPAHFSRFTEVSFCRDDFSEHDEELVDALEQFGAAQREAPVLFYEEDAQLLLVSRYRRRLARALRFVIADPETVENLVDKSRFYALAERVGLPIPATRRIDPTDNPAHLDLR